MEVKFCISKRKFLWENIVKFFRTKNIRFKTKIILTITYFIRETCLGTYYLPFEKAYINLEAHRELIKDQNNLIKEICNTISHEAIHHCIKSSIKNHYMFDEESIVNKMED